MSERRLSQVLTRRFSRVAWTALAGYALVVVLLFALAAEMALRRSLEHSADFIQSLLGAYRDSTSAPGAVMPSALADQLGRQDRKSTRLNSSHDQISYAVFCLKKKTKMN